MARIFWKGKSKFYREFMTNIIKTTFWLLVLMLTFIGVVRALFQIR